MEKSECLMLSQVALSAGLCQSISNTVSWSYSSCGLWGYFLLSEEFYNGNNVLVWRAKPLDGVCFRRRGVGVCGIKGLRCIVPLERQLMAGHRNFGSESCGVPPGLVAQYPPLPSCGASSCRNLERPNRLGADTAVCHSKSISNYTRDVSM